MRRLRSNVLPTAFLESFLKKIFIKACISYLACTCGVCTCRAADTLLWLGSCARTTCPARRQHQACVCRVCSGSPIRAKRPAIRGVLPIDARDINGHAGRQEVIRSDGRMRCSADERFLSDEFRVTAMVAPDCPHARVGRSVLRQQGVQFAGTLVVKQLDVVYDCCARAWEALARGFSVPAVILVEKAAGSPLPQAKRDGGTATSVLDQVQAMAEKRLARMGRVATEVDVNDQVLSHLPRESRAL